MTPPRSVRDRHSASYAFHRDFPPDPTWREANGPRIVEYARRFGALQGPLAFAKLKARFRPEVSVRVSALAHPLVLRPDSSDRRVFNELMLHGTYELDRSAPAVIVDAGANVGVAAARFATRFPTARIVAIEPDATNHALLVRNVAPYTNVTAVHGALWSHAGTVEIANPTAAAWARQVREVAPRATPGMAAHAAGAYIPSWSIPTLMACFGLDHIDLLKIDIEGAEEHVFGPASAEWIERVSTYLVEIHLPRHRVHESAFVRATHRLSGRRFSRHTNLFLVRGE